MAGIPDELIEEIRAQADIVQIIGEHVALRRSGRTYRGACPLHGGERPNFSVDPQRGIFKCFVCGQAGDVFAFPMKRLGLSFLDAVRYVAERTGIEVPEGGGAGPEQDPHRDLREAVAFAADWFRSMLWDSEEGRAAREYLGRREVPDAVARDLGLGYAPEAWRALRDAAHAHGIEDGVLERAGLIKRSERAKEPYDHFRGRVIFPIEDLRSRPIGFGGRTLREEPDTPKYLNSPDTPIFHKGRLWYGLARSRGAIRRERCALIVEGYMDFVSLVARGIDHVVAPLGTGLTPDQARILSRYADRAILLYDSDPAGLRATFRAGDELLRAGLHPHVATLPAGEDPDSLVRRHGGDALRAYLDEAVDLLERKIQILRDRGFLESIDGKRRAVDALLSTVRAVADEALRDLYLDRIAQVTGVRRATLERELRASRAGVAGERATARERRAGGESGAGAPFAQAGLSRLGPERKLLVLLLRDETLLERVGAELEPEDFETHEYGEIYRGLLACRSLEGDREARWTQTFTPDLLERVYELAHDPEEFTDPEAVRADCTARIIDRRRRSARDRRKRAIRDRSDEEWMRISTEILRERRAGAQAGESGGAAEDS